MQPQQFIDKWQPGAPAHELNERAGAQAHFIDLCRVLGVPEPADPEAYCFERGLTKTGSASHRTDGFADVWKRGCVACAYGWADDSPALPDEEILRRLLALNHERAAAQSPPKRR